MAPLVITSAFAASRSRIVRTVAMDLMPSCTVPICSKMVVILPATHPDMDTICHASGSAMATIPTARSPVDHSTIDRPPTLTSITALMAVSVKLNNVISRNSR